MEKCDCIEEMKKALLAKGDISTLTSSNKKGKIEFVSFDRELLNMKTGKSSTGQSLSIEYMHEFKDGRTKLKTFRTFATHHYCPFCGVEYNTDN